MSPHRTCPRPAEAYCGPQIHPFTIGGGGLQILTYARYSWPLSSEGSLACYTHCSRGIHLKVVLSENPRLSHLFLSVWQWSCHYLFVFLRLGSVVAGIWTPNLFACDANALTTAAVACTSTLILHVYKTAHDRSSLISSNTNSNRSSS